MKITLAAILRLVLGYVVLTAIGLVLFFGGSATRFWPAFAILAVLGIVQAIISLRRTYQHPEFGPFLDQAKRRAEAKGERDEGSR